MSTAEELKSLGKLLSEVVWCSQIGSVINLSPSGQEVEIIQRKEDALRGRIVPLLHSLEHNAFDAICLHFSKKVSRPLASSPKWYESQYAERAAWSISVIAEYLDQTYVEQIEDLVSRAPRVGGSKVKSHLERALNRIPT